MTLDTCLTQIHDNGLVHFLPQVSPEYLNQGNLQRRNLAVHEYTREVQLHLYETNNENT